MNPPVVTRAPLDLRPHPLNCQMPRWAQDSQEWFAFLEDIQAHGIKTPIRITERNEVVDGETRRLAAKALNLPEIPCVIVESEEVAETMLRELQFRRNLTKGQRAYLSVPLFEPVVAEAIKRRSASLLRGTDLPKTDPVGVRGNIGNSEDFARSLGFSKDLLDQARRLHVWFSQSEDLRLQFEPKILSFDNPVGLGAALAGIASVLDAAEGDHGGGQPKDVQRQFELFTETFTRDLRNRLSYWEQWDEETRIKAIHAVTPALEEAPWDFLDSLAKRITAERRRRNKETQPDA